ncbi:MAG: AAA family ATPase, partial [Bacteroidetes bacterium]|nr:AAA family ATPase [Bacteroidota bacterium]
MPQTLTLPFTAVKLRLSTGEELAFPLSDANALQLGPDVAELAKKFAGRFQKKQLDRGKFMGLLDQLRAGEFSSKKINVPFPKATDGISYPAFELSFDCFFQNRGDGVWGILPALGMEAMAPTEEELVKNLTEVVRVEFSSKKRLQSVHQILAANWFDGAEIVQSDIRLKTWSPSELVDLQKDKQQELLPKVAEKMTADQPRSYGQEEELALVERILKSRFSRNVLLVGASGTGKTALVQELARQKKTLGIEPEIWETTASVLIKELTTDSGWQDNLSHLIKELTLKGDMLFVRNLAELFEVGQYEGNAVSLGEYLRPALSRGEITLIGECTPEERARIELRSPGYLAFFQTVQLEEPKGELERIILQKTTDLAGQRKVTLEPEAVREIIRLHRRFSPYSGMPGKPIRFLESILFGLSDPPVSPKTKKPSAVSRPSSAVSRQTVLENYCEESGLPPFMLDPALPMDVEAIRNRFNTNVFGQERAVGAVVDMLAAVKTALTRTGKPIASFLFAGPTGVGKTELAKELAAFLFGSRERMLRFDMSEFSNPWSVMRLTGEGYYAEGLLTSAVRREPFCVLLFDEIEKADPKFYELLLQILSEGRLTDSRGRMVNFCSAIIIMTSNIGAANLSANRISWKKELNVEDVTAHFTSAIERYFRPELFNRIDAVVAFSPLTQQTMRHVVERELDLLKKREGIRFRHIGLSVSPEVLDHLAQVGYDARFGARYLQRAIREKLTVPLAQELNRYEFDERLSVQVTLAEGHLRIETDADPLGFDLLMEQWDKLTLAEKTSHQRRKIMLLLESPLFLRFQSELDLLESEKKRQEAAFWREALQAKRYAALLESQAKAESVNGKIQDLEVEIALASMEQGVFQTDFGIRLEAWEAEFFSLQVELHSQIFPKRDVCHFAIYGSGLEEVLRFYLALFAQKNIGIKKAETVWFREDFVGEMPAPAASAEAGPEDGEDQPEEKRVPVAYYRHPCPDGQLERLKFPPPQKDDLLTGIELELTAPCVWLYLRDEKGFQRWETNVKGQFEDYGIFTSLQKNHPPEGIHRKAFYQKNKPRRIVGRDSVTDSRLGINAPSGSAEMLPAFLE